MKKKKRTSRIGAGRDDDEEENHGHSLPSLASVQESYEEHVIPALPPTPPPPPPQNPPPPLPSQDYEVAYHDDELDCCDVNVRRSYFSENVSDSSVSNTSSSLFAGLSMPSAAQQSPEASPQVTPVSLDDHPALDNFVVEDAVENHKYDQTEERSAIEANKVDVAQSSSSYCGEENTVAVDSSAHHEVEESSSSNSSELSSKRAFMSYLEEMNVLLNKHKRLFEDMNRLKSTRSLFDHQLKELARQIEEQNIEQQSAAEHEDFERAAELSQEIEQANSELISLKTKIVDVDSQLKILEAETKSNRHEQSVSVINALPIWISCNEEDQEEYYRQKETFSRSFAAVEARLRAETERISLEMKHVERDEESLAEETRITEDAIESQSGELMSSKLELESTLFGLSHEITELENLLAKKKSEEKRFRAELDSINNRINEVRKKYDRQLQRLVDRRDMVMKTKAECQEEAMALELESQRYNQQKEASMSILDSVANWIRHVDREISIGEKFASAISLIWSDEDSNVASTISPIENQRIRELEITAARTSSLYESARSHYDHLLKESDVLANEIMEIDEKLPKLEAEKKTHAALKRFKEAGIVAKDIKTFTTLKEEHEIRIQSISSEISDLDASLVALKNDNNVAQKALLNAQSVVDIERLRLLKDKMILLKKCQLKLVKQNNLAHDLNFVSVTDLGLSFLDVELNVILSEAMEIKNKHNLDESFELHDLEVVDSDDDDDCDNNEGESEKDVVDIVPMATPGFDFMVSSNTSSEVINESELTHCEDESVISSSETLFDRNDAILKAQLLSKNIESLNEELTVACDIEDYDRAATTQDAIQACEEELNLLLSKLDCTLEYIRSYKMEAFVESDAPVDTSNVLSEGNLVDNMKESHTDLVVLVMGCPGSGKKTHCQLISQEFGYRRLNVAQLLQLERSKDSEASDAITSCEAAGESIPVDIIMSVIQQAIDQDDSEKFLIEGFPIDLTSLSTLEASTWCHVEFVLYFTASTDHLLNRVLHRNDRANQIDDADESSNKEAELSEDEVENIRMEIEIYQDSMDDILSHFRNLNKLHEISTDDSLDVVTDRIRGFF